MGGGTQLWLLVDLRLLETDTEQMKLHLDWMREDLISCATAPPEVATRVEDLRTQILARLHYLRDLDALCAQIRDLTAPAEGAST